MGDTDRQLHGWPREHIDRVIALAGVFQATSLVKQLARDGQLDNDAFAISIDSLFIIDAPSTEAIFGGKHGLAVGLAALCRELSARQDQRDMELARYWVSLMFLERKLIKRNDLLSAVREGIEAADEQAAQFSRVHENVIARLADLYKTTVSTLSPRIMVSGEPQFLHQPANANRIRALLLAAMRSTILWRQLGGTRLGLLFGRKNIVNAGRELLAEVTAERQPSLDNAEG